VTRSSIDRKDSVFLSAPIFWLTADPIPPNREVVFSAVALIADSVFWYLENMKTCKISNFSHCSVSLYSSDFTLARQKPDYATHTHNTYLCAGTYYTSYKVQWYIIHVSLLRYDTLMMLYITINPIWTKYIFVLVRGKSKKANKTSYPHISDISKLT